MKPHTKPALWAMPAAQGRDRADYPPPCTNVGRFVGALTQFVGERGSVQHVRADSDDLPPWMWAIARAAVVRARFGPGQLGGRDVERRIRVEAVFESRALPPAHGVPTPARPDEHP
jgi:hypothetical protein